MDIQHYIDKWLALSLSTKPAERKRAEDGVFAVYEYANVAKPEIIWRDSPSGFERPDLGMNDYYVEMLPLSKIASHWSVFENRKKAAYIRGEINSKWPLPGAITSFAIMNICKTGSLTKAISGPDCNEYIVWDAMREHEATNYSKLRSCMIQIAESAGWWEPFDNRCYISDRPTLIKINPETFRLHCENGPAIAYKNEAVGWLIDGILVNEQIVMAPHSQSVKEINTEENVEVKRIRIERYGWDQYLSKIDAKTIDKRKNDIECTKEVLVKTDDMTVLLCHCPSTGRIYTLEVPNNVDTCEQAQNYLWSGSRQAKLNLIGRS